MLLGIDTSLPMLSAALVAGEKTLGSAMIENERSRNEKLLPTIDWLLLEIGAEKDEISAVVVTRGPGSFTGVRIGIATAQGIAFSLGVPILAMSTHEALIAGDRPTLVYGDAGRGEYYVSAFRDGLEVVSPVLATATDLDGLRGDYEAVIDLESESRIRSVALCACRRVALLGIEESARRYGETTPIYVRPSEAEARLEQREKKDAG